MFAGHFGAGFAGKAVAPRVSLGTLFLSVQFADLLWPILLIAGVEHVRIVPGLMRVSALDLYDFPLSHSLVALAAWGVLIGAVYAATRRSLRGGVVLGLGVVSHWLLDVVMHRPDMPILPRGPYLGLGLWNSVAGTLLVEGAVFSAGIALYVRATKAADRVGVWSLWSLVVFLAAGWIAGCFATPPPNDRALAWGALATWVFIPWGYWIDRHRAPREAAA